MVKVLYKPSGFQCSCKNCGAVLSFHYTDEKRVHDVFCGIYYMVKCPNCLEETKTRDVTDDYRTPVFSKESDKQEGENNE